MKKQVDEYKIVPIKRPKMNFAELWRYRELLYFFAWRDIKVKYKQTLLGIFWALLQPLGLMILFSVIWEKALKLGTTELPYPVFAYSGLLYWGLFSFAISSAGNSMISNANIIKKIYFPRTIIPIASVLVAGFDFAITFLLFIVLLFIYNTPLSILRCIYLFPMSIFITVVSALGLSFITAAANITYRDFRYVLPFILRIVFFLSPIVIPFSSIDSNTIQTFLSFNPLTGAIALTRAAISGNEINVMLTVKSITVSIMLLLTGFVIFKKSELYIADRL